MWFRRVCSDGFRRFRRFVQTVRTVRTVQTVCSDDIVMGDVGLLGLAAGWSSWVGRYILLINPVDKTLVCGGWFFQEGSR